MLAADVVSDDPAGPIQQEGVRDARHAVGDAEPICDRTFPAGETRNLVPRELVVFDRFQPFLAVVIARRVVILRRRLSQSRSPRARRQTAKQAANLWTHAGLEIAACEVIDYEYQVLVTNLTYGVETLAPMYRARGDAENPFDELKNQWGWGGFTTQRLATSQQAARLIALVYNWWTLYNRLVTPGQHHEAITSRPRLLGGVAKQSDHAGQKRLAVRLLHADAPDLKPRIIALVGWLQDLLTSAEQLDVATRWQRIVARILAQNFGVMGPAPPMLPAPA